MRRKPFFKRSLVRFLIHMLLGFGLCSLAMNYIPFVPETAGGALLSFLTAFVAVWLLSYLVAKDYFYWFIQLFFLCKYFVKEFFRSNYILSREIMTPGLSLTPAVVKIPLEIHTDYGLMALVSISNLTPGTLVLGISEDRKYLFLHTLYLEGGSVEAFKMGYKAGFEKRLIKLLA
ncbi:Na+/H+ antiporter subunit E [Olivibacter sitiensis]|uniref:Na+/H+ antiporter subunit E n=1 Tax=Olivibacter sitiensis TaxID=376470 RepID=UPI0009FC5DA4|nr:Na+/H+ antiporter subunit E [Olivibacter sitiensis]